MSPSCRVFRGRSRHSSHIKSVVRIMRLVIAWSLLVMSMTEIGQAFAKIFGQEAQQFFKPPAPKAES